MWTRSDRKVRPRSPMQPRKSAALLWLLVALALPGGIPVTFPFEAQAAEIVRDVTLGVRIEDGIAAGDVHAFRLPLAAGTKLDVRLERKSSGKDDGGPRPVAVILDPASVEIGRVVAGEAELRIVAAASGTYRIELRAETYSGEYELRLEGDPPEAPDEEVRRNVVVSGEPVIVHVDAPAESSVEIEVRRRSGAPPRIDSITDALGHPLDVFVRSMTRDRIRLFAIPVAVEGGFDVTISAAEAGSGTYEVRARARDAGDRPSGGGTTATTAASWRSSRPAPIRRQWLRPSGSR